MFIFNFLVWFKVSNDSKTVIIHTLHVLLRTLFNLFKRYTSHKVQCLYVHVYATCDGKKNERKPENCLVK